MAAERHATEAFRLKRRASEAEAANHEARRQLTALRLSSRTLTLDQAETILQGEEVGNACARRRRPSATTPF